MLFTSLLRALFDLDQDQATFIRKGEIGDWTNYFSKEQEELFETKMGEACRTAGLYMKDLPDGYSREEKD
tara:strand:+ start:701 stop:910 length:210 start_codon:yes stop_codon:yes gene_type:complete